MGKSTYCDICYLPIKLGDNKHVFGIATTKEYMPSISKETLFANVLTGGNMYSKDQIKFYDVCEGCKEVLEHFFFIRKDELEKIKIELERMVGKRRRK